MNAKWQNLINIFYFVNSAVQTLAWICTVIKQLKLGSKIYAGQDV